MVSFSDFVHFSEISTPHGKIRDFPEDKFLNILGVPVFVAHEATLSDGRKVVFGPEELARIAANCNRRISETGDYAVVTLGHTPKPGEDRPPPEAVGFAGPFRLGEFAGKPAILADFHIFQEYRDLLRKYPRRSPEFRLADDLGTVHLDPIALLGAEPPRLDMGLTLLYAERAEGGQFVERYAAALPAGSNTFVPDGERYAMNDEELRAIVEALERLDWVQWCKKKMAEESASGPEETEQMQGQPSDQIDPEKAKQILKDGEVHGKPLTEEQRKMFGAAAGRERDSDPALRERYQLLEKQVERQKTDIEALRRALDQERAARVNAERYSQLAELRQYYAFDLDKEVERCRYSRMSDEQFREHVEVIRENYQRIPVGERLPPLGATRSIYEPQVRDQYTEDERRRARELAIREREAGRSMTFEQALEQVHANGRK